MSLRMRMSGLILDYLVALPLGCAAALLWANTFEESYYRFAHAAAFAVNDVGIVFFFALITKEVAEATIPGGALHPWRRAAMPVAAAMGSVAVSVALYLSFAHYVGEYMLEDGWVVACAVDIPGSYVVARMIFGRHPAVPFLLLLAISADAIGLACIAVLQPIGNPRPPIGLGFMVIAIYGAFALRRAGAKNFWLYLAGPGLLSWWALYEAGVHPALALVPIVPFFPHGRRDQGLFEEPAPQAHDTLTLFERWWRLPVEGVLFFFGLVNAGVPLHGLEAGSWGLPIAALGRPLGIVAAVGVARMLGLHLPARVGWRDILVVGAIASIGLVFALFFATAVMPPGTMLLELKMGALITLTGAVVAAIAARLLRVGRFAH
ncbi:MAG TPA: Na+/H+ antiporter NhaA [Vicinamibacterales bacterium]|jgi:NhaA family Na+:H+ antiporter|nr:Na+/H+ antiporter NhaA [Vicinamibacterales bacterium]